MKKIVFLFTSLLLIGTFFATKMVRPSNTNADLIIDLVTEDQRASCLGGLLDEAGSVAIFTEIDDAEVERLHVGISVDPNAVGGEGGSGNFIVAIDPDQDEFGNIDVAKDFVVNVDYASGFGETDWEVPEDLPGGAHSVVIYEQDGANSYVLCSSYYVIETTGESPIELPDNCLGEDTLCECDDDDGNITQIDPPICEGFYCKQTGGSCIVRQLGANGEKCIEDDNGNTSCLNGEPVKNGGICRCEHVVVNYSNACLTNTGKAGIDTAIGCIPFTSYISAATFFLAWGMGVGGGVAFLLIIFASFQVMTSAGDPKKLQGGKELLTSAIIGLLMVIFAAFLLRTIGVNILGIF